MNLRVNTLLTPPTTANGDGVYYVNKSTTEFDTYVVKGGAVRKQSSESIDTSNFLKTDGTNSGVLDATGADTLTIGAKNLMILSEGTMMFTPDVDDSTMGIGIVPSIGVTIMYKDESQYLKFRDNDGVELVNTEGGVTINATSGNINIKTDGETIIEGGNTKLELRDDSTTSMIADSFSLIGLGASQGYVEINNNSGMNEVQFLASGSMNIASNGGSLTVHADAEDLNLEAEQGDVVILVKDKSGKLAIQSDTIVFVDNGGPVSITGSNNVKQAFKDWLDIP